MQPASADLPLQVPEALRRHVRLLIDGRGFVFDEDIDWIGRYVRFGEWALVEYEDGGALDA